MPNLLQQVADMRNVTHAFRACARGKRNSRGCRDMQLELTSSLVIMSEQLRDGLWQWQPYNHFEVCDPKRRTIYAAPFCDRVVHHAIHQVIAPWLERQMPRNSWACRKGMGTRSAIQALAGAIREFGRERTVVKLDVANYFASIDHDVLQTMLAKALPDQTLDHLLMSLLESLPAYKQKRAGIPLGNFTSQLFANFYLSGVDRLCEEFRSKVFYIRYMDDMVLVGRDRCEVYDLKDQIINFCQAHLKLNIPLRKTVPLAADPVPFLGYLVDSDSLRVLSRTKRRHRRQLRRMNKAGCRASKIATVVQSFSAFASLDHTWAD